MTALSHLLVRAEQKLTRATDMREDSNGHVAIPEAL